MFHQKEKQPADLLSISCIFKHVGLVDVALGAANASLLGPSYQSGSHNLLFHALFLMLLRVMLFFEVDSFPMLLACIKQKTSLFLGGCPNESF